jgi:hypothetical protein
MSTTLDDPTAKLRELYTSGLAESAAAALAPTKKLLDASPARQIATKLEAAIIETQALHSGVHAKRAEIESDRATRPEVLRDAFREFAGPVHDRANELQRSIKTHSEGLRTALHAEALPQFTDPARELLARQDVEITLRNAQGGGMATLNAALELASRPETAAAMSSGWGQLTYKEAGGLDESLSVIMGQAIETTLKVPDEGRRRAAAAFKALDAPVEVGGGNAAALYSVGVMANGVLSDARKGATEMPRIGG